LNAGNTRIREQLENFYSPLIGMRDEIRSKTELRTRIHSAADNAWRKQFERVDDPLEKRLITDKMDDKFSKILQYSNDQLKEDLVPTYRKMLELFSLNMWLAEPSTLQFYNELLEYVEIWNRFLKGTLPLEVLSEMDHGEDQLQPFYTLAHLLPCPGTMVPSAVGRASNSAPLKDVSHLGGHLAVRIATMRAVAMRSDGPNFGQSVRSW
jgi:hypothetical protein